MISCKIIDAYRLLLQKRFQRNVRKQNYTDLKFGSTLHIEPDRDLPSRKKKERKRSDNRHLWQVKETQQEAKVS